MEPTTETTSTGAGGNTGIIISVVLLLVVVGGGAWFLMSSSNGAPASPSTDRVENTAPINSAPVAEIPAENTPSANVPVKSTPVPPATSQKQTETAVSVVPAVPMSATITYTSGGFSPKSVTIAKGGTVTFVNKSGSGMWVASDQHPTHTAYAGTTRSEHCPDAVGSAFDQCTSGDSYSFTFGKAGSWDYHNHVRASDGGMVVVQ
jgi:plastocyanin